MEHDKDTEDAKDPEYYSAISASSRCSLRPFSNCRVARPPLSSEGLLTYSPLTCNLPPYLLRTYVLVIIPKQQTGISEPKMLH